MVALIVLYFILYSGSTLGLFLDSLRFEKALPLTCIFITVFLFLFGIVDALNLGVTFLLLIVAGLYIVFFVQSVRIIRGYGLRFYRDRLSQTLFTPSSFLFGVVFLFTAYANRGRLAIGWDEFSHWATVVKQMVLSNVLGSSREAVYVSFKSYPPAMALFQYFIQKVNLLINPQAGFCDWLLFFAYQIYSYSFIFYFFRFLDFKRPYSLLLSFVLLASPTYIFSNALSSIFIDPFLGLVAGAGMAALISCSQNDFLSQLYVFLCITTLVLAKDAGLLFAAFLLIAYFLFLFWEHTYNWKQLSTRMLYAASFLIIPKLLWEWNLKINNVDKSFDKKFDLGVILRILLGKESGSYRIEVIQNYIRSFFSDCYISIFDHPLVYFQFVLILLFGVLCIVLLYRHRSSAKKGFYHSLFWLLSIESIVYLLGLLLSYMFKFTEYEAVRLASFSRYFSILANSLWMFIVLSLPLGVQYITINRSVICALLFCLTLCSPQYPILRDTARRIPAKQSITFYDEYDALFKKIKTDTEENCSIYFISQETTGYDAWIAKYSLIPRITNYNFSWSIGEPFYDGDIWTCHMTASEWMEILTEEYDYVALYRLNDYFYQNFGHLFSDPSSIAPMQLYSVNKTTHLLDLCP